MTIYERGVSTDYRTIDRFADGFGWFAYPRESGRRASHAIRNAADDEEDGSVWLFDPLWAPGVTDEIDALGPVAGVAVLFDWHARDADRFARHYDVPVTVPDWLERVEPRVDAPVRRIGAGEELGDSGFRVRRHVPYPGWREAVAHRDADGTLYVPETVSSAPSYTVGGEELGIELSQRLVPPRNLLGHFEPARVLVGHGEGVLDDADGEGTAARALEYALAGSRRRFPRALVENGPTLARALLAAIRE